MEYKYQGQASEIFFLSQNFNINMSYLFNFKVISYTFCFRWQIKNISNKGEVTSFIHTQTKSKSKYMEKFEESESGGADEKNHVNQEC